jgi:hypothetical protein
VNVIAFYIETLEIKKKIILTAVTLQKCTQNASCKIQTILGLFCIYIKKTAGCGKKNICNLILRPGTGALTLDTTAHRKGL